jgi:hypothetical protein
MWVRRSSEPAAWSNLAAAYVMKRWSFDETDWSVATPAVRAFFIPKLPKAVS